MAVYNSAFQTVLSKKYLNILAKNLKTNISVGEINIVLFDQLVVKDLYIEDLHKDTLLYISELRVRIDKFSLKEKKIFLEDAVLTGVYFNLKKYKSDSTNNLHFIVDHFAPKNESQTTNKWKFKLNDVTINNGKFNYDDADYEKKLLGVDFKHIAITDLNIELNNIEFIPQGVNCDIIKMQLYEESGFQIDSMSTHFNISPKGLMTENLNINTPHSAVKGNVLFITNDYSAFSNFIEDVTIKSYFDKSLISFSDLSYFAPTLDGLKKSFSFEGEVKGSIANLKGRDLSIVLDDGTKFKGKANISGIPNTEDMFMHITVKELITSKKRLEQLPMYPFSKETFLKLPANFNHLGMIRFKGTFTGFYHDFVAYGKFNTLLGSLTTDVAVKVGNNLTSYDGNLITNHFDLGKFFEMKNTIGDITMDVKINGEGFTKKDLLANLDGEIKQVVIKGYEYNNVEVKGYFKNQMFNGVLAVEDENISFDFDGNIDVSNAIPKFNFVSKIKNAKLAKLNLIDSKEKLKTRFSTELIVDLEGDHIDNMIGEIEVLNSKYYDKLDSIIIDRTLITSSRIDSIQKFTIQSDVLDFNVEGVYSFSELADVAKHFISQFIPSTKNETLPTPYIENDFQFDLELHNSAIISKLLLDGAEFSSHTSFTGRYTSSNHFLSINGDIPYVSAFGLRLNNGKLNVKTENNTVLIDFNADKIYQNDSIYTDNFSLLTSIANDSLLGLIKWENEEDLHRSEANIVFNTYFKGYDYSISKITESFVYLSDTLWSFNDNNFIEMDSNILTIRDLKFSSKNQNVLIDGVYSGTEKDRIDISLTDFNLNTLKMLIPEEKFQLNGIVDGTASLGKRDSSMLFTSNLVLHDIKINDYLVGDGEINSVWNSVNKSVELDGKLFRDSIPSILLEGVYFPEKVTNNLDMNFELNETQLSLFESFISEYVKDLNGTANARISVKGTINNPELNGNITLSKEASFFIKYLNTAFTAKDMIIDIAPDMISFDNVELNDKFKNKGFVNGTVYHDSYKNINLDIGLDVNTFLVLNTTVKDNSIYYGKAFVTGTISVGSYDNFMNLDVDVKTEKGTVLNIPLDKAEEIEENNFIEFVMKDTVTIKVEEEVVDLSHLNMNFNFDVTPAAEVRLIFDEQIGDVMKSTGSGNIKLNVSSNGDLEMFGDYIVKDGDYLFTLQNVINKRFDLEEGGTIAWDGSPYNAIIDITAIYRLRARLYDLLASMGDTTDVYKKRIPVDLKLNMKNNMMNPDIGFDIELPTADEETKTKVRSVLYVNDEEENIQELNKQAFSLLVLNRFLPPPGAESTTGNASVGAVTSSELLSNQLSNWLSKMSNDFDIGVNYSPGDEISNQELEVALSTQIFNDRLIIDSNFGISDREETSGSTQNSSNIIGDITVEYKITKDGKIRVKAFNTSNQYSLENPNSDYTQGVGLSYREDFDNWGEFIDKLFGRFNKEDKNK